VAFKSDYAAKRTWDPDPGWEIFDVTKGPDYPTFVLRHPTRPAIQFWGETLVIEDMPGVTPLGHPMRRKVFKVHDINGPPRNASEEQKNLIEQALFAYGGRHNGPCGPVEVLYVD
jgi:hypothetical protein